MTVGRDMKMKVMFHFGGKITFNGDSTCRESARQRLSATVFILIFHEHLISRYRHFSRHYCSSFLGCIVPVEICLFRLFASNVVMNDTIHSLLNALAFPHQRVLPIQVDISCSLVGKMPMNGEKSLWYVKTPKCVSLQKLPINLKTLETRIYIKNPNIPFLFGSASCIPFFVCHASDVTKHDWSLFTVLLCLRIGRTRWENLKNTIGIKMLCSFSPREERLHQVGTRYLSMTSFST